MDETERLLEVVRGRNAKTVGLQFPVGLRTKAVELAQAIGHLVSEAEGVDVDLGVHGLTTPQEVEA